MLHFLDALRDVTFPAILLRMLLAAVCGGIIGIEREYKRRPAGFRTHILICIGAAMTTLTSQYLAITMGQYTDLARLGAQVVAGIGFIGAGTIIVTRHQRVKGLTTAAGLWGVAIIGLSLGAGFYEGGILTTLLILTAELFFAKLEYRMLDFAPEINLYMEYTGRNCLEDVLRFFRENNLKILNMEFTRVVEGDKPSASAIFTIRLTKHYKTDWILVQLHKIGGVEVVEEL